MAPIPRLGTLVDPFCVGVLRIAGPEYDEYEPWFLALAIVVVAGGPVLLVLFVVWQDRRNKLTTPRNVVKYGLLFEAYRERMFWWYVLVCALLHWSLARGACRGQRLSFV